MPLGLSALVPNFNPILFAVFAAAVFACASNIRALRDALLFRTTLLLLADAFSMTPYEMNSTYTATQAENQLKQAQSRMRATTTAASVVNSSATNRAAGRTDLQCCYYFFVLLCNFFFNLILELLMFKIFKIIKII